MTPQQLKNSILQLAIQGKLVKQISEEGTGEELFKIIQEEKKELIKKGKIRKQKSLPQIKPDEVPFSIPNTWKWIRLGDVGDWGSGGTPLRTNPDYYGGDIPWLKTGDLTDGEVRVVSEYITDLALEKTSIRINPTGSVLMAMYGATIGKLGILTRPMTTNQACCACIVYPNVFNKYLFYFLLASRNYFIKRGEGGAQPNISRAKIIETCMPLPPFEEQKRIVKKIEEILPLVECYGNAWEKLKELNKKFPTDIQNSILQEAIQGKLTNQQNDDGTAKELIESINMNKSILVEVGKTKKYKKLPEITEEEIPFNIPKNWEWVRLGDIGETNIGLTYKPTDVSDNGTIVLRSSNIQNGMLDYRDIVKVDRDIPLSKMCQVGDIVICARNGSKRLVGKAALVDSEGMSFGAFMAIYRSPCNPYILRFINSIQFRNSLLSETGTTTINQITQDSLRKCLIPLPPVNEQRRIVNKIDSIMVVINRSRKIFS